MNEIETLSREIAEEAGWEGEEDWGMTLTGSSGVLRGATWKMPDGTAWTLESAGSLDALHAATVVEGYGVTLDKLAAPPSPEKACWAVIKAARSHTSRPSYRGDIVWGKTIAIAWATSLRDALRARGKKS